MNKISNINFGEVIFSDTLKKAMIDSQENQNEIKHLKNTKPDCYIDLLCTQNGEYYLKASEIWDNLIITNGTKAKLLLKNKKTPYVSDILEIYEKFQKKLEKRIMKLFK